MQEVFYPGDKVRFLDQEGEAIVVEVDGKTVMVETEEGFTYPYAANALVRVGGGAPAKEAAVTQKRETSTSLEKEHHSKSSSVSLSSSAQPQQLVLGKYGLYIAYIPKKEETELEVYFINKTDYSLLYVLAEQRKQNPVALTTGNVAPGEYVSMGTRNQADVNEWPTWYLHAMYFRANVPIPSPATYEHKVVAKKFFSHEKSAPLLNKKCYLYQLDGKSWSKQEPAHEKIEIGAKKESLEKVEDMESLKSVLAAEVVDLHLEAIPNVPEDISPTEILPFQANYAEKKLDEAVSAGLPKITFIHGSGDGVLKREIHRIAREHPHVSSHGKGDQQKFGNGATFLKIR